MERSFLRRRCIGVAILLIVPAACGSGSTSPTTVDPPPLATYTPGRYTLSIQGLESGTTPGYEPCAPFNAVPEGNDLHFPMDLAREGSEWVVRSAPGTGDLVMRLRDSARQDGLVALTGSIAGSANDAGTTTVSARPLRVVFSPTNVEGTFYAQFVSSEGWLRGSALVSNQRGHSQTCPTFYWFLIRGAI